MTGAEQVLIEDWCQQYPSHSVGSLAFGADGALYVSAGDGASFNFVDYGQDGTPSNPCGDPPARRRRTLTPPTAEGGRCGARTCGRRATRSGLDGDDPPRRSGHRRGAARQPAGASSRSERPPDHRATACATRSASTFRPGTTSSGRRRRLERLGGDRPARQPDRTRRSRTSAGPATRAHGRQAGYDAANLSICENLYAAGDRRGHRALLHATTTASTSSRTTSARPAARRSPGSRSRSPAAARTRPSTTARCSSPTTPAGCIWVMPAGRGRPARPAKRRDVRRRRRQARRPRDRPRRRPLLRRPRRRTIRRIRYSAPEPAAHRRGDRQPDERGRAADGRLRRHAARATRTATRSTYAWDLDGDGAYDDSTAAPPAFTYTAARQLHRPLRVTDRGASDTTSVDDHRRQHARRRASSTRPPPAPPGRSAT